MPRLSFHDKLVAFLGSRNVYFNPPEGFRLKYPCIVYNYADLSTDAVADDGPYIMSDVYEVTYISQDVGNDVKRDYKQSFKYSKFIRHFVNDGLAHDVFRTYD